MSRVLAHTSMRVRIREPLEAHRRALSVRALLCRRGYRPGPSPVDLLAGVVAESVDPELWHCDRHFELIARLTGQRVRRLGT